MLGRRGPAAFLCGALLVAAAACTTGGRAPVTLRVLASPELADMRPVLDDLRRDTGIELVMDHRGTVNEPAPGGYRHDLAWLSSDRYFRLKLNETGDAKPLGTSIMLSPAAVGLKRAAADRLRRAAGTGHLSWADLAAGAAEGRVRFGMADPRTTGSGLVALIGAATAAAGTGAALRPGDVTCDRLRGLFTGQAFTATTPGGLTGRYVELQQRVDGLIAEESALLSLNAGGRLREPLEIIYPRDGIVVSEYPLMLLDPAKRGAYDRVVNWLKSRPAQQKIMERTLRRPLHPAVPRDPRLRASIGNAMYFPDRQEVVDRLLENYSAAREPGRVIFLLDFSGSMRGARMAELRAAFAGLGGDDDSAAGKFVRFHRGEQITVIRFGGRVLDRRSFTVGGAGSMTSLRDFVETGGFDENTAIWSALDHAYREAGRDPRRRTTVVLMTDGRNNAGMSLDEFLARHRAAGRSVHTYTIRYGEADPGELVRAARAMGGRMADGTEKSLLNAFKEIRGCR